ncbi:hypothetical protein ACFSSA_04300 [Luteolibacter algae]|uniref:DUF4175 family protein n=1 Tax=Luteolibacter algae TaxID=454151 RepID=A0ABW5D565_9BACT
MGAAKEIEAKLTELRRGIRRVQLVRGALVLATVLAGGLLAIMAVDYLFAPLGKLVRGVLFGCWLASLFWALKKGFSPLFRKISLVQIARWIEVRHPEMEERISTAIELSKREHSHSAGLIEALDVAARQDAAGLSASGEIKSAGTSRKWLGPAIVSGGLMLLLILAWPRQSGRLLLRVVMPFSETGNAGAGDFLIEPGEIELLEGRAVEINIRHAGVENDVELWIQPKGKKAFPQTLRGSKGEFHYVLDPVRESFRYYARSGKSQSDVYQVSVVPIPEISNPQVVYDFRSYTGLPRFTGPLGDGVNVLEGTRVTWSGVSSSHLESARLMIGGKSVAEGDLETTATGTRIKFSWEAGRDISGTAVVMAGHRLGKGLELMKFPVAVIEDREPVIDLHTPSPEVVTVKYDQRVELKYDVVEDFGVAKLQMEIDAGGDRRMSLPRELPRHRAGSQPGRFDGESVVTVADILEIFPGVKSVRLRLIVRDNRPFEVSRGPGSDESRWISLNFDNRAESLARQELRIEHEGARRQIEEALRAAREAKNQLTSLEKAVEKAELSQAEAQRLAHAKKTLIDTNESLLELAERMVESIHAKKAEKVESAADKLYNAAFTAENAVRKSQENRRKAMQQARETAEAAVRDLEQIRDEINRDQQRIEDLAKVQEMAQAQEELARQAEESLRLPLSEEQLAEWREQQKKLEQQLAIQMKNRPEALAEALSEQAERATDLMKKAGALADYQAILKDQAAAESGNEKAAEPLADFLQAVLVAEQKHIFDEVRMQLDKALQRSSSIADTLPLAAAAADGTLQQIAEQDSPAALEYAMEAKRVLAGTAAASAEIDRENAEVGFLGAQVRKAELEFLAERQAAVAKVLEEMAGGDPGEALKAVQSMQAVKTEELAAALDSVPMMDSSGEMMKAIKNSGQGARLAGEASKLAEGDNQKMASARHGQASQHLRETVKNLEKAARNLADASQKAAARGENPQQAPLSPEEMAKAAEQAAQAAANQQQAMAAEAAAQAAGSLTRAAEDARAEMSGRASSGYAREAQDALRDTPGAIPGGMGSREETASPGIPPQMERLGISSDDWVKIRATLSSDRSGGGVDGVPAEYRALVRDYFESMSKK